MIKEITKSINATLYQRISSPFYGTYIFSWIIYNWQISLILIFSGKPLDKKIEFFKAGLLNPDQTFNWGVALLPLLATCILLVIQPWLKRQLFVYSEWNKAEGLKKRDEFTNETMLTLEQSNELRQAIQKTHDFHQTTISNKDKEIQSLKNNIENKDKQISEFEKRITDFQAVIAEKDTTKSALESVVAENSNKLEEINQKYVRLGKILSRSRKATRERLRSINDWYISNKALDGLVSFIGSDDFSPITNDTSKVVQKVLTQSDSDDWKNACHRLLIQRFGGAWSFDVADKLFDILIKPYAHNFNETNIDFLISTMQKNSQISDRRRAESDLKNIMQLRDLKTNPVLTSKSR